MRHVGKKMAVSTGLIDFTKIKPSATRVATFRAAGKKSIKSQPQASLPAKCTMPNRDISDSLMNDIRKAIHLRWLVDNPDKTDIADLQNFDNSNAVFYARQGRMFAKELLALGNSNLTRKVARSYQRRNKCETSELPAVEFNRLRKELGRFHYGTPVSTPLSH